MAIAVTVTSVDASQDQLIVQGSLALTGNYGGAATHGDTMSLAGNDSIKSSSVPTRVEIFETPPAGTAASGYVFNFCPGTTQANGVVEILTGAAAQSPLTELTQASAYPAGLTGAVIQFKAWFPAFV
jgi:hypothetical protein